MRLPAFPVAAAAVLSFQMAAAQTAFRGTPVSNGQFLRFTNGQLTLVVPQISDVSGLQAALNAKAEVGHSHDASAILSGILNPARLGSGTPSSSNWLRGDGSWVAIEWADVAGKPSVFPPDSHTHPITDIVNLQAALDSKLTQPDVTGSAGLYLRRTADNSGWILSSVSWTDVEDKPSEFFPASHTHSAADVASGLLNPARLGAGTASNTVFLRGDQTWASVNWADLSGKPAVFQPDVHTHSLADIVSSGAATGQVPQWNGSSWTPATVTGNIVSVFGRTGAVTAQTGDYAASQISNTPSGSVSASTVQGAINELDQEKASISEAVLGAASLTTATVVPRVVSAGTVDNSPLRCGPPADASNPVTCALYNTASGTTEARLGVGVANPLHAVHLSTAAAWQGIRADRDGVPFFVVYNDTNGDGELVLFNGSNYNIVLRAAGASYISGSLAIGKSTATTALDVNGTVSATAFQGALSPAYLTQSGASTGQVLAWSGTAWAPQTISSGGGSESTPFTSQTSNFTAASNSSYYLKSANLTVTLPANPSDGDWVALIGSVTGCVVNRNGKLIMGLSENLSLNTNPFAIRLVYIAADSDWRLAP